MKNIETLVEDIYGVLRNDDGGIELTVDQQAELGARIAAKVAYTLNRGERKRKEKTLRMSEIGKPCLRQLWYDYHTPAVAEPLLPHTRFKFLYGDIIEEVTLFLAKVSGHEVTGEQEELIINYRDWTIKGRRDALIDGVLVDVKSASTYSFKKFKEGLNDSNDAFGYRDQLDAYNLADPSESRPAGWLVADKQNGHLAWAPHTSVPANLPERLDAIIDALESKVPPKRGFDDVPEGKSGNMKLGVECSYCPYKQVCWPTLRAFAYERGPIFLTEVRRQPNVPELDLKKGIESE